MPYNLGSVGTAYNLGYVGTYTGGGVTYDYQLTSHGEAHPNSIMAQANFATTGTVEIGVVTDTDQNKVQIDWQAISDGQLWREDIDTLDAVTVTATEDTTATFTLAWRVVDTGEEGQFTGTLNITEPAADTSPAQFTFTDQAGVEPSSVGESNAITISDVDAGEDIPVTVTGGEYAVDAGAGFGAFTSTGTNVQLGYQIKVRNTASSEFETATNTTLDAGGTTDTFTRTTRAAVLPTLDTPLPDLDLGQGDAVSLDLDDHFSGASSYGLSGLPAGSGLSFSGSVLSGTTNTDDIAASPFTLTATAYSADGSIQDAFSVTVVDDIAPVISVFSQTTTNTAPILSGSAGDAVSLTLVVTGVGTYNPVPTNSSWTQQLPTVALGEYPMTLNGQDAAGNNAVEATGTLSVVNEIVTQGRGLFRPLFIPTGKALFGKLFR